METYEAMRAFADSWALLAMMLFFVAVVLRMLTPGAKARAADAAAIPFNEQGPAEPVGPKAQTGPARAGRDGSARDV